VGRDFVRHDLYTFTVAPLWHNDTTTMLNVGDVLKPDMANGVSENVS
jgi:hypothetical protein